MGAMEEEYIDLGEDWRIEDVRCTQDCCSFKFQDGEKTIWSNVQDALSGKLSKEDIPRLRIVKEGRGRETVAYSVDNRRWAFYQVMWLLKNFSDRCDYRQKAEAFMGAQGHVKVEVTDKYAGKKTTDCDGRWILVKGLGRIGGRIGDLDLLDKPFKDAKALRDLLRGCRRREKPSGSITQFISSSKAARPGRPGNLPRNEPVEEEEEQPSNVAESDYHHLEERRGRREDSERWDGTYSSGKRRRGRREDSERWDGTYSSGKRQRLCTDRKAVVKRLQGEATPVDQAKEVAGQNWIWDGCIWVSGNEKKTDPELKAIEQFYRQEEKRRKRSEKRQFAFDPSKGLESYPNVLVSEDNKSVPFSNVIHSSCSGAMHLVFLLDISGSMRDKDCLDEDGNEQRRIDAVCSGIKDILQHLHAIDDELFLSLVLFNDTATTLVQRAPLNEFLIDKIEREWRRTSPREQTKYITAIEEAQKIVKAEKPGTLCKLYLWTDGRPGDSKGSHLPAIAREVAKLATIDIIIFGPAAFRSGILEYIADIGGGVVFKSPTLVESELRTTFGRVEKSIMDTRCSMFTGIKFNSALPKINSKKEDRDDWKNKSAPAANFTANKLLKNMMDWSKRAVEVKMHSRHFAEGGSRFAYHGFVGPKEEHVVMKTTTTVAMNAEKCQKNFTKLHRVGKVLCEKFAEKIKGLPGYPAPKFVPLDVLKMTENIASASASSSSADSKVSSSAKFFTAEQWIPGRFRKYNGVVREKHANGEGDGFTVFVNQSISPENEVAQAFSHFSWEYSLQAEKQKYTMIMDVQGGKGENKNELLLTDCQPISIDRKYNCFGGDFGREAILGFFQKHECNAVCSHLKLKSSMECLEDFGLGKIPDPVKKKNVKFCSPVAMATLPAPPTQVKEEELPVDVTVDNDGPMITPSSLDDFGLGKIPDPVKKKNVKFCSPVAMAALPAPPTQVKEEELPVDVTVDNDEPMITPSISSGKRGLSPQAMPPKKKNNADHIFRNPMYGPGSNSASSSSAQPAVKKEFDNDSDGDCVITTARNECDYRERFRVQIEQMMALGGNFSEWFVIQELARTGGSVEQAVENIWGPQ